MKKYLIPEGWHYSIHLPRPYFGKKVFRYEFEFTEDCIYDLPGTKDDDDVNKLGGFSFGYHKHHSIRIGWVYNLKTQEIDLYWYVYEDGFRRFKKFDSCKIKERKVVDLILTPDAQTFIMKSNNVDVIVPYRFPDTLVGYYLAPYFGGNIPAQHDTYLYMGFK